MGKVREDRIAIFLHAGAYDRLHQGAAIAAAGCASGRKVDVFFFWFALEALISGKLAEPSFSARDDLLSRFEAASYPSAQALLDAARATGNCTVYACTASSGLFSSSPDQAAACVDHFVGWATILDVTAGVVDRFYL